MTRLEQRVVIGRQESPPDAECLKNRYTRHPFILDGQVDELRSDKCQSEHGWKSQVRSEAEHFTENRLLAVAVVCNLCQNRLCYTVDGTAYQGSAHRVPLVGLGVETARSTRNRD